MEEVRGQTGHVCIFTETIACDFPRVSNDEEGGGLKRGALDASD